MGAEQTKDEVAARGVHTPTKKSQHEWVQYPDLYKCGICDSPTKQWCGKCEACGVCRATEPCTAPDTQSPSAESSAVSETKIKALFHALDAESHGYLQLGDLTQAVADKKNAPLIVDIGVVWNVLQLSAEGRCLPDSFMAGIQKHPTFCRSMIQQLAGTQLSRYNSYSEQSAPKERALEEPKIQPQAPNKGGGWLQFIVTFIIPLLAVIAYYVLQDLILKKPLEVQEDLA
eukprot:NODE_545_length_860_cov_284.229308_g537_i0.p1 GENE.NODE_545_length_860_cov_284.229308_g537_i0~~NODE_545_length_860_cov_284.229308_g537_i0.p1  ORF type:complete len:230 (-),score=2.22 NODE_545_length_860_cov_284.229308_g537_i0:134-823(-)